MARAPVGSLTVSAARTRTIAAGALYAVALAWLAAILGTWQDDEYTLATTAHGAFYAWQRAIGFEEQAPLYFALEAIWRELSPSVWFARMSSVVCAVGTFAAALRIGRRIAPARDSLPFALAVACNPFAVFIAVEIRLYALGVLLSGLLWLGFDAGFATGSSRRARIAFAGYAIAAIYTQYFLGFFIVGAFVALLAGRRWRSLVPFVLTSVVIAIAIVPVVEIARGQVGTSGVVDSGAGRILERTLLHPLADFVLPFADELYLSPVRRIHEAMLGLLVVLVVAARPKPTPAFWSALGFVAAIEALYLAVAVGLRLELYPRHFLALFLPSAVAAYVVLDRIERAGATRTFRFAVLCYAVFDVGSLAVTYRAGAKIDDVIAVDRYLDAVTGPGDTVAIFPADALPAYARYYRGGAHLAPFPHAVSGVVYDVTALDVPSSAEARDALLRLRGRRIFFVESGSCRADDHTSNCGKLRDALASPAVHVVARRAFYEASVSELAPR